MTSSKKSTAVIGGIVVMAALFFAILSNQQDASYTTATDPPIVIKAGGGDAAPTTRRPVAPPAEGGKLVIETEETSAPTLLPPTERDAPPPPPPLPPTATARGISTGGGSKQSSSTRDDFLSEASTRRPWLDVDLAAYDDISRAVTKHSGLGRDERYQMLVHFATAAHVSSICVTGFNDGLAVAVLLKANPKATVRVIGKGDAFSADASAFLRDEWRAAKHGLVNVATRLSVYDFPAATATRDYAAKHAGKCDLTLLSPGSGGVDQAIADIKYLGYVAEPLPTSVLLVDRTNCDEKGCIDAAVAEHLKRGTVRPLGAAVSLAAGSLTKPTQGMTALYFDVLPLHTSEELESIVRGSWREVDLRAYNELGRALNNNSLSEGHSAELVLERQMYIKLAQMSNVKRICEIGFNGGHSASLWLMANPTAEVIMFDLWQHHYAAVSERKLRDPVFTTPFGMKNTNERLRIVKGSSLSTVRQFVVDNPTTKCDLISVDGGHTHDIAVADIRNMFFLANPAFNVLVVDDTNCESPWCVDAAIAEHQRRGTIKSIAGVAEHRGADVYGRGVTVLQFATALLRPSAELNALRLGAWTAAVPEGFAELATAVAAASNSAVPRSTPQAHLIETTLAGLSFVKRICIVGPSDTSALPLVLLANPHAAVVHFALSTNQAVTDLLTSDDSAKRFGLKRAGKRLSVVPVLTPTALRQFVTDKPSVKCDLFVVDGYDPQNKAAAATVALKALHYMANPDQNAVVVRHTNCDEKTSCIDAAVAEHQSRGTFRTVTGIAQQPTTEGDFNDGVTVLQFAAMPRVGAVAMTETIEKAILELLAAQRGSWTSVNLTDYDALATSLLPPSGGVEGNSAQLKAERQIYVKLAQMSNVKRICEIGFNAGASASLWLKANPTADVLMFDLWAHEYAALAESYLRSPRAATEHGLVNVDKRLTIVKGSSQLTVREYFTRHPEVKCDLLSVDGGHTYDMAVADITNMQLLANPDFNVLVVDDTNCDPVFCVDAAIAEHQRRGTVRTLFGEAEYRSADARIFGRGVTVFQYTTPPRDAIEATQPMAWRTKLVDESYSELLSTLSVSDGASAASAKMTLVRAASIALASDRRMRRLCVAGFDRGLLPAHLLVANPTAEVVVFPDATFTSSLASFLTSDEAAKTLRIVNGSGRLKLHGVGSVGMRVMATQAPQDKCDAIFFPPRSEKAEILQHEIKFASYLAAADRHALVVEHSTCTDASCNDAVVEEMQRRGVVVPRFTVFPPGPAAIQTSATVLTYTAASMQLPPSLRAVRDGSWRHVSLVEYDALGHALLNDARLEGDFLGVTASRRVVITLAQLPFVKRICEIGLGAGTGASMYLKANPSAEVLIFDLYQAKLADAVVKHLKGHELRDQFGLKNVASRLTIVKGASQWSLRRYAHDHPDVKCDLMVLDGAWDYASSLADIRNMQHLANPENHVLVVDDSSCDQFWCGEKALEEHERRGTVQRLFGVAEHFNDQKDVFDRGLTVLQYRHV